MIIDIHAHVLPGVDHGAKDWDMSLKMLAESAKCGVEKIIATPHYLPWEKGVTAEKIEKLCQEAKVRLKKEYGLTLDIYPGNEIYYGTETVEALKSGKALTLAGSRYVLVEFEPEVLYQTICKAVRDLRNDRYIPIIAHMERYKCLERKGKPEEVKAMGALLQMNIGSLQGGIFDTEARMAKQRLLDGVIDFVASDMHDLNKRSPMSKDKLSWVQRKLDSEYQKELLYGNAEKILAGIKA